MTPDVREAIEPIVAELETQIDVLDRQGRQYAEQLMHHHLYTPRKYHAPHKPDGMHPYVARAIRDMVLDEATTIRLQGPRRIIGGSRA